MVNKKPVVEDLHNGDYYVGLDCSHSNGILHFTHEVSIWVHKDDNGIKILHADEVTPGGWFDLCPKGIENKYPGITKMIGSILEED